ncbi:MAG: pyridoxamine 5'-phosphate oxidase family protein [Ferruginibacter sp.]
MAKKALSAISEKMANLDICMMTTQNSSGALSCRPMSNNGDVTYEGLSHFFTYEGSQKVKDISVQPHVVLSFEGPEKLQLSVTGKATLIRSRSKMEPHWVKSLNQWFKDGLDTEGIVMIRVKAVRVRWWQGEKDGELKVK